MKTFPLQRCILSWGLVWFSGGTRVKSAVGGAGTYMISTVVQSLPPPPHCLLRLATPLLFWTVRPVMAVVLWGGLSGPSLHTALGSPFRSLQVQPWNHCLRTSSCQYSVRLCSSSSWNKSAGPF